MMQQDKNVNLVLQALKAAIDHEVQEIAKKETELRTIETEIPRLEQTLKEKIKQRDALKKEVDTLRREQNKKMLELKKQQDEYARALKNPTEHPTAR